MQKISTLWPHLAPFWPYLTSFGQCGPCANIFASCARVRARIFTKMFVWVFYYHISLSFKFHTDPSFCCGDIFSDTRYFKVPIRQGVGTTVPTMTLGTKISLAVVQITFLGAVVSTYVVGTTVHMTSLKISQFKYKTLSLDFSGSEGVPLGR